MAKADLQKGLQQWLKDYPGIFAASDIAHGVHLIELATKKDRVLLLAEVTQWRRKASPTFDTDYMNLVFEGERELVLCQAGFGFAPSYLTVGDAIQLPDVVCFQDYVRFRQHLEHLYKDESQKAAALQALMSCLAILEGAALVRLDIAAEQKDLEPMLNQLEAH